MKKRFVFALCIAVIGIVAMRAAPARAGLQDFRFKGFEADYYLTRDAQRVSQLKVVEKLTPVFPDYDQNHGLLRAIPEQYKGRDLNLKVLSVTDGAGTPRAFTQASSNHNRLISIRSDNFVHGEQVYVITYTERDVITQYSNHDEWYWDTIGDQWEQSFGYVTARIHTPVELVGAIKPERKCYTGTYGTAASDCTMARSQNSDGTLITVSTTRPLNPRENLSFVLAFAPGTFARYHLPLSKLLLVLAEAFVVYILPPLVALVVMLRAWRKRGRDPKGRGVIIAQYKLLKGVNPLLASVILHEAMELKAISASILDMCIRGILKLYEVETKQLIGSKTTYELEVAVDDVAGVTPQERTILSLLFTTVRKGERAKLKDLSNKLYSGATALGTQMGKQAAETGYFVADPNKLVTHYTSSGILLLGLGVIPIFFGRVTWLIGIGLAGLIVIVIGKAMPARTAKGVEAKEYLEGLKLYMKMAEADRIKMLQSPEGAQKLPAGFDASDPRQLVKLYEKLLPYAMLFGMEKEWAKQFADLYKQPPEWYGGNGAFNALAFSQAMGGFTTAAATSFTAPSSSSGSGFGGGGFSGGGGGGGGGGGL